VTYPLRLAWLDGEATCEADVEGRHRRATLSDPEEWPEVDLGAVTWTRSDDDPVITYGVPGYPVPDRLRARLEQAALDAHEDRLDYDRDHEQWRREQSL
jgi:hypothetical protein